MCLPFLYHGCVPLLLFVRSIRSVCEPQFFIWFLLRKNLIILEWYKLPHLFFTWFRRRDPKTYTLKSNRTLYFFCLLSNDSSFCLWVFPGCICVSPARNGGLSQNYIRNRTYLTLIFSNKKLVQRIYIYKILNDKIDFRLVLYVWGCFRYFC